MSFNIGNSGSDKRYPNGNSNSGRLPTNRSRSLTRLQPIFNSQHPQHPQFQPPQMGLNGQHRPPTQPPDSTEMVLDRVYQQDNINEARKKNSPLVRRQNLPNLIFGIKKSVVPTIEKMVLAAYDKLNPGGAQLHFQQIVRFIRRKFRLELMIRHNIEFEVYSTLTRMIRKGSVIQSHGTAKFPWEGSFSLVSPDRGFGLNLTSTGEGLPQINVGVHSGQAVPGSNSHLCRTASTKTVIEQGPQRNSQKTWVKPKRDMTERFYHDIGLPCSDWPYSETNDLLTKSFGACAGKPIPKDVGQRPNTRFSGNCSQPDESGRQDFQSRPRTAKAKAKAKTGKALAGDGPSRQRASSHRRIVSPVYDTKSCGRIPRQFRNTMDRQTALDMRRFPQMSKKKCLAMTNAMNEIREHGLMTGHSGHYLERPGTAGRPETAVRPRTAARKARDFLKKPKVLENSEDDILAAEAGPRQSEGADISAKSAIPEGTNPACVDNYTNPKPNLMGEPLQFPMGGPNRPSIGEVQIEEFLRSENFHDLHKSQTDEVKEHQKFQDLEKEGLTKKKRIRCNFEEFSEFDEIASGSFGKVFQAYSNVTRRVYALKFVPVDNLEKNETLEDILLESRIQRRAKHPNLVRCYGSFIYDSHNILVLELCLMGDLGSFISKIDLVDTPSQEVQSRAKNFTRQIVSAVSYVQSKLGFIHTDLKPQNVMMAGPDWVKITDFGCSVLMIAYRHVHSDGKNGDFRGGTLAFFPPEILLAKKALFDSTADVWSIGCITYELLTKYRPFFPMEDRKKNEESRDARIAIRKMNKAISSTRFEQKFYDKLQANQDAISFFQLVFVERTERPLIHELSNLVWLKGPEDQ